jgi:hypothetical protein
MFTDQASLEDGHSKRENAKFHIPPSYFTANAFRTLA